MKKSSSDTSKKKYGKDIYAVWGAIGGRAKVKKGIAVILERMTPEERKDFYERRNKKRWPDAGS